MCNEQLMKRLLSFDKNNLMDFMKFFLKSQNYTIVDHKEHYLIATHVKAAPVCLCAHIDTVFPHSPLIRDIYYDEKQKVMWYPGGAGFDDRAGIYAIIQLIERGHHFSIILDDLEECGNIGATECCNANPIMPFDAKFFIQIDRRGHYDSVYYNNSNKEFENFINSFGFITANGSYTSICEYGPTWNIGAVNLSCGYLNEHTQIEMLHLDWLEETIDKISNILEVSRDEQVPRYEYIGHYSNFSSLSYHCKFCNTELNDIECFLTYDYSNGEPLIVCDECFSKKIDEFTWCEECNNGFYIPDKSIEKDIDSLTWRCKFCREKDKEEKLYAF